MRRIIAGLALIGSLSGVSALAAQGRDRGLVEVAPRPVRSGVYLSAGVGIGREQYSFSDDPNKSDALWKPTVTVGIGGTPSPNVRVGFEYSGWFNHSSDLGTDNQGYSLGSGTEVFHQFLISVQAYPDRHSGFYIKGGAGLASSGTYYQSYDANFETGFGWDVGVGYEAPLSRNVAIAPVAEYRSGIFTKRGDATLNEHVLNLGVSFTFQSGHRWR